MDEEINRIKSILEKYKCEKELPVWIGLKLRNMRCRRELPVEDVAEMLGVSRSSIEQVEGAGKNFSCIPKLIELYQKIPIPEPINLSETMKKNKLTYKEIVEATGIAFKTLKEVEKGREINLTKIKRLRKYLESYETKDCKLPH